jgi:cytochrome b6-f complex iron-sulfur subunit
MTTATAPTPTAPRKPGGRSPREIAIERLKARGLLAPDGTPMPRRKFLLALTFGWFFFAAAWGVIGNLIMGGFMVPRLDFGKSQRVRIGPPDQFEQNAVSENWKATNQIWVVRSSALGQDEIFALSTVCTHLGCTPNWLDSERKFKCPCHGSGFRMTGINFEGPAPRPLERFKIELVEGELVVDKSVKFLYERGEWENPQSYYLA